MPEHTFILDLNFLSNLTLIHGLIFYLIISYIPGFLGTREFLKSEMDSNGNFRQLYDMPTELMAIFMFVFSFFWTPFFVIYKFLMMGLRK